MERLVTPPRRGTSPARGPPPPCEQALKMTNVCLQGPKPLVSYTRIFTVLLSPILIQPNRDTSRVVNYL